MIRKETLWKINLKFVKDEPMICVNFISIIYFHKKKKRNKIFVPPLVFVLKPMPFPRKKTAASGAVPPGFVLFIVITNCAQCTPFNTKKEGAFCAAHLV